jgi:hypothetical protein
MFDFLLFPWKRIMSIQPTCYVLRVSQYFTLSWFLEASHKTFLLVFYCKRSLYFFRKKTMVRFWYETVIFKYVCIIALTVRMFRYETKFYASNGLLNYERGCAWSWMPFRSDFCLLSYQYLILPAVYLSQIFRDSVPDSVDSDRVCTLIEFLFQ